MGALEEKTHKIETLNELETALETRLTEFEKVGARASDIALEKVI